MEKFITKHMTLILFIAGISFCIVGISDIKNMISYDTTTATITDIQTEYTADDKPSCTVIVKYRARNKSYEEELGLYEASMKVGDKLEIAYNPENPEKITVKSPTAVIIRFGFAIILFVCSFITYKKRANGEN